METIEGKLASVRYYNKQNAYIVMNVRVAGMARPVLMTGYMPDYNLNMSYRFTGEFVNHPKYGPQFQISGYEEIGFDDRADLVKYLASQMFTSIGEKLAGAIVDTLGLDAMSVILNDPDSLDQVPGMNQARKATLVENLSANRQLHETLSFLVGHGLGLKTAMSLLGVFKDETRAILSENPYRMTEVEGIGFKTADAFATRLNFPLDHPYRYQSAMLFLLRELCFSSGATFIKKAVLLSAFQKNFHTGGEAYLDQDSIVAIDDNLYPHELYQAEKDIARDLRPYFHAQEEVDVDMVMDKLADLEKEWAISYDETQKQAVCDFLRHDLLILSGGPGTGKTTVTRAMLKIYEWTHEDARIACCAPTGRASKRLSEATGYPASTIHRLLKWDMNDQQFKVNRAHPLDADVLVVDEFSMVDTRLFAALLAACQHVQKILLVGDEAQLPSISPGQVLKDLIASKKLPCVFLKHVFRQKKRGGIIQVSHEVREDRFSGWQDYDDLHFYPSPTEQVVSMVEKIVRKAMDEGYDLCDVQVLSPMYQGAAGIDHINSRLQKLLNPPARDKKEIHLFSRIYREQDKVLQLKNRPDDNVYNGDVGVIISITSDEVAVDFDGSLVTYERGEMSELALAYAISIHKAQGSEFKIVIMPVVPEFHVMLKKNLIYTGMTRARQTLFLIGDPDAFLKGIATTEKSRATTLETWLNEESSPYDFL